MTSENLEFLYGVDSSTNEDVAWTDIKSMWQELQDPTIAPDPPDEPRSGTFSQREPRAQRKASASPRQ